MRIENIKNDKSVVRLRRQRNFVAKNNKHRGGFHTSSKYERQHKPRLVSEPMLQEEINDWWEHNL